MRRVGLEDTVSIRYTEKLENGTVFASSEIRGPLKIKIGSPDAAIGLQRGLVGMEIGEKKTIKVPPEEAMGPKMEELIVDIKRSKFPDNIIPAVGKKIKVKQASGNFIDAIITHMTEDTITVDANHPLAGKTLIFDVELMEIT